MYPSLDLARFDSVLTQVFKEKLGSLTIPRIMETVLLTFIALFALDYAPNPKLSKFKNRISYLRLFVMGPSVIIFIISSQIIDYTLYEL